MKLPGLIQFRLCKLENKELCERVAKALNKMHTTGDLPSRHIPAQPDKDFDLLVAELIVRFSQQAKFEL